MTDNADQAEFWGGDAGENWVAEQARIDEVLKPVLEGVLARADLAPGLRVLDVGCGTGQSTLMAADAVGPQGHVRGADFSPPMVRLARDRAAGCDNVTFDLTDVATHVFPPGSFDRVISRFGVMFFADSHAAFANIAAAMAPGARLSMACWGRIEENPYFTLPARLAREIVGTPPKSDPDAPGPFAFRDINKVQAILAAAGFDDIATERVALALPLVEGPDEYARLQTVIGPAARTLDHFSGSAALREALRAQLAEAIAALPGQAFPAEINFFTARKPA